MRDVKSRAWVPNNNIGGLMPTGPLVKSLTIHLTKNLSTFLYFDQVAAGVGRGA